MFRRVAVVSMALCLLGQGCVATTPKVNKAIVPDGQPSPDGPVGFNNGFGPLPGKPPTTPPASKGSYPTVVFDASLPDLPPDVTILREWTPAPDGTILRNITSAVQIPASALEQSPRGTGLLVSWDDDEGNHWNYGGPPGTLCFDREGATSSTNGQALPAEQAIAIATSFLTEHGINRAAWDTTANVEMVKGQQTVWFAGSRDNQTVVGRDGHPVADGTLVVANGKVQSATFLFTRAMDRSNYPALTMGDVIQRLRTGGTNPVPDASPLVTLDLDRFALGLYRHEVDINGVPRVFYLPALIAHGTLRRGDSRADYLTAVPLVSDYSFSGR